MSSLLCKLSGIIDDDGCKIFYFDVRKEISDVPNRYIVWYKDNKVFIEREKFSFLFLEYEIYCDNMDYTFSLVSKSVIEELMLYLEEYRLALDNYNDIVKRKLLIFI